MSPASWTSAIEYTTSPPLPPASLSFHFHLHRRLSISDFDGRHRV